MNKVQIIILQVMNSINIHNICTSVIVVCQFQYYSKKAVYTSGKVPLSLFSVFRLHCMCQHSSKHHVVVYG